MSFTKAELASLAVVSRRAYTPEQIEAALRYQIDNQCSAKEVSEQFGISTQTLASHRNRLLEEAGVSEPSKKAKKRSKKSAE